jgi:DNA-binding transcriptional ArsR family regulator
MDERDVKWLDADSMRALAHPLRMQIIGRLRRDGPATATQLAKALGESSGATSYHLRSLAKAGFVEDDAERGRGRERWWRAAQRMTSWRPEPFLAADDRTRAAEEWLSGYLARQAMSHIDRWQALRATADPAWVTNADQSDYLLTVTPEQLRAVADEISEVVERHEAAAQVGGPDPRARTVRLLVYALPDLDGDPDGAPDGDLDGAPDGDPAATDGEDDS